MRSQNTNRIWTSFLVAQLTLLFAAPKVMAQQEGVELARRAAELYEAEEFREAAMLMLQAYELLEEYDIPTLPILLYNAARAYEEDGRCVMSSRYFGEFLELFPEVDLGRIQDNAQRTQMEEAFARSQEQEAVESQCAQGFQNLVGQADSAIANNDPGSAANLLEEALSLSDEPETRVAYVQTLLTVGGDSCARATSYLANETEQLDLSDAQRTQLGTDLARAQECQNTFEREAGCVDDCETENERRRQEALANTGGGGTLGLVVAGVGGAVLIGAIIHDVISQGTIDDYEAAAGAGNISEYNQLAEDISSAQTLSMILYGVGAVGVVTGAILFFTAGGSPPEPELQDCDSICWDFGWGVPSGNAAGLWLSGTF